MVSIFDLHLRRPFLWRPQIHLASSVEPCVPLTKHKPNLLRLFASCSTDLCWGPRSSTTLLLDELVGREGANVKIQALIASVVADAASKGASNFSNSTWDDQTGRLHLAFGRLRF